MRASKQSIAKARQLRRSLSVPEVRLWSPIVRVRAPGKPESASHWPYVPDFYCAKASLAVEIDGASHDMGDRPQRDERRDAWAAVKGITVIRIAATDLMLSVDGAADAILRMAVEWL
jgi:very-short-patch-repair endonuclease